MKYSKPFTGLAAIVLLITACKKEGGTPGPKPVPQAVRIIPLNDTVVKPGRGIVTVDVNEDGRADLGFDTQLVGDPIGKTDKLQFIVISNIFTSLAVNSNEESPVLNQGDSVTLGNIRNAEWYYASELVLMQQHTHVSGTVTWLGNWIGASRKYLPFQRYLTDGVLTGWVELTADKNNKKLVLHRAGISKELNKGIRAGE